MRTSGKVSLLSLIAVVIIAMIAVVLLFSKQGPGVAGGEFMDALARGDDNELTNLSYLGKVSPEAMKKQWEFATQVAGKNYGFTWKISSVNDLGDSGSVNLVVDRNYGTTGTYDENFALPMIKTNGQWKVDVANISRALYPGLPRASG